MEVTNFFFNSNQFQQLELELLLGLLVLGGMSFVYTSRYTAQEMLTVPFTVLSGP
jgi:hypothetical protein